MDEWELASYGSSKVILVEALEFVCAAEFKWLKYLCSVGIWSAINGRRCDQVAQEGRRCESKSIRRE